MLYLLTFVPPLIITLIDPRAFLNALEYAGSIRCCDIMGLLPVLMVWRGRYVQHRTGPYRAPGGQWALGIALDFLSWSLGLRLPIKRGLLTFSTS